MYLLSLTDMDYIWITAFLAVNFIIAYHFRRKNQSSDDFLFAATKIENILPFIGSFGLIEIILAGIGGAYFGFNVIYVVVLALILQSVGQKILIKRYQSSNVICFNDYISANFSKVFSVIAAIFNILLVILGTSLTVTAMFKSLQAVMGWGFINNVMGLLGLCIILTLVGGRAAITYNKLISSLVIIFILLASVISAIMSLGGLDKVINNLNKLAVAQNLPAHYYVLPVINHHTLWVFALILIGLVGFRLISFSILPRQIARMSIFGRVCVAILLIMPGIIAIATPLNGGIAGKNIVTIMAQLPDGQTGYVVKAVDNNDKLGSSAPGIIPPVLNPKTSLLESGQYNYELANIVMIRHYLPSIASVGIILMLLAGFILTIGDLMLMLGRITVNNVLLELNLISKYGKIGELWSLQISIVAYTGVTLILSYFLFLHYNFLSFTTAIVSFMVLPLTILIGLILVKSQHRDIKNAED